MSRSIVISGLPAVGKTTVARILAEKLGMKHVAGGDMLKVMAEEMGYEVTGPGWWDTDDGKRFLVERRSNPEFDREVDRRLVKLALEGGYVMTSYAVPWLVGREVMKVWLKASRDVRARRMSMRDGISVEEAMEIVGFRDEENVKLYEDIYGYRLGEDLEVFHLVIDTEDIGAEDVADVIADYARGLWGMEDEVG